MINKRSDQQAGNQTTTPLGKETRPAVSVLIVGYNTKDLVLQCLAGLFAYTQELDFEVLFVDCSDDGSEQAIREQYPTVRVIDNDQNLGFGRGNNFLARHAEGDYLLLLNPDTLIKDNAVGQLYDFAQQHQDGGAWGGVTRLPNGEVDPGCKQSGTGLGKAMLLLFGLGKWACPDVGSARTAMDVPSLSGAFMLLPHKLWQTLGGFDESFFMYAEETDLCYRVRQAGHRVLITAQSSIVHLVGSGSSQSAKRMLAMTRGDMHLARKHFGPVYVYTSVVIRWLYSATRYAMGVVGLPLLGRERAAQLRKRHASIIIAPRQWMYGWSDLVGLPPAKATGLSADSGKPA